MHAYTDDPFSFADGRSGRARKPDEGALQVLHDLAHDPRPEQPEHEAFESPY